MSLGAIGAVGNTLAELRDKWGLEILALFDPRFDTVAVQYMTFAHRYGVQALGQELTIFGWASMISMIGTSTCLF